MTDGLEPTVARFHALARSSPWRWTTLRFTWNSFTGPDGARPRTETDPVRAHLRRPGHLRIEDLDGRVQKTSIDTPSADQVGYRPDRKRLVRSRFLARPRRRDSVSGQEVASTDMPSLPGTGDAPKFGDDGLVIERPRAWAESDDPMWQNYTFVAALDPVELADPRGGRIGTRVEDLRAVDHNGRPAWEATVHPTDDYDPRCPCCSLLLAPASFTDVGETPDPGLRFPDAHWVRVDVETGVCVVAEQVGGSRAGTGHEAVIDAVDEEMPDELFSDSSP